MVLQGHVTLPGYLLPYLSTFHPYIAIPVYSCFFLLSYFTTFLLTLSRFHPLYNPSFNFRFDSSLLTASRYLNEGMSCIYITSELTAYRFPLS